MLCLISWLIFAISLQLSKMILLLNCIFDYLTKMHRGISFIEAYSFRDLCHEKSFFMFFLHEVNIGKPMRIWYLSHICQSLHWPYTQKRHIEKDPDQKAGL